MNKNLLALALKGLAHLEKSAPVDITAAAASLGWTGVECVGVPLHPQTAYAINGHYPETFDDDDIAVFETTFFSKHF